MHMYVCLHQRSEIQKFNITDRARTTNAIRRLACVGVSSRRKPLLALVRYFHISSTMRAGMAAAATLLFCGTSADAFVSPSAFAGTGVRAGSREALSFATARAAGAMRSRPTMSVLDVGSSDELDKITADNKEKLVVVDYSTTWCGPCKQVLPKFEALATEYSDAIFIKVVGDSTNDASQLMKREGVRSVPAFHFWKGGSRVDTVNGANEEALEETLRTLS